MSAEKRVEHIVGPAGQEIEVIGGQAPPHSIEAEHRLISSVIADDTGEAWAIAVNCGVKAKAFYEPASGLVWGLIHELRQAGQSGVDVAVLAEELQLRGDLEKIGGVQALSEMTASASTSANTRYYAELVVLLWEMRHTVKLAASLRESALDFSTRDKFAESAADIGRKLIGLGRKAAKQSLEEKIDSAKDEVLALASGKVDRSRWVPSGLERFDAQCKPFGAGGADDKFIVIGGGSGHGKSVALRQIARASLHQGQRVLAYVRETGVKGFCKMMASAEVGYDLDIEDQPVDRQKAFSDEMERMIEEWANKRLFCIENEAASPLATIEDLCSHARAWCHLHGTPDVILVDYLQIFDTDRKGLSNSEARVAFVSHQLQALQRELDCVMVVAAQLNESGLSESRQAKHDEDGKLIHRMPHRGDLRESQAIYHDADRMIFLYMPPEDTAGNSQVQPGLVRIEVWWYQEKRRTGRTSAVKAVFEKCYTRFVPHGDKRPAGTAPAPRAPSVADGVKFDKSKYLGGGS